MVTGAPPSMMATLGFFSLIMSITFLMPIMVVVIMADIATISESVRSCSDDEILERNVPAQIVDREPAHVEHQFDNVFPDVVDVTLNGSDDHLAFLFHACPP